MKVVALDEDHWARPTSKTHSGNNGFVGKARSGKNGVVGKTHSGNNGNKGFVGKTHSGNNGALAEQCSIIRLVPGARRIYYSQQNAERDEDRWTKSVG